MAGSWDIRRVYLYLVSFATLMMMVVGTVFMFQGVVNLAFPNPQAEYELKMQRPVPEKSGITLRDEEIKEEARQMQAQQRYYQIRQIIDSLIAILIALPVYLYHWRKIQRSEAQT